jgi:sulfate adenylyltransferase
VAISPSPARPSSNLLVATDQAEALKRQAATFRSRDLHGGEISLLSLLLSGYCSPLRGYMGRKECASVLAERRLADGTPWSIPVLLSLDQPLATALKAGERVALRDPEGAALGLLTVDELWQAEDLPAAAAAELATLGYDGQVFVGGAIQGIELPVHYDFAALRLTPEELRATYAKRGWRKVLACQPTDMVHRAEAARIVHAARIVQANVLVQAPVTDEQTTTLNHYTRVRCLEHGLRYLPERGSLLTILPVRSLRPWPSGRTVLWRAQLARSAGATHLLVEPEWWGADTDRLAVAALAREAGIELIDLPRFARDESLGAFLPVADATRGPTEEDGTIEVVRRVRAGLEVPEWLSFPEVVGELRHSHPVRGRQGVTIFFTGLSGAGKSTIARVLLAKLLEMGERTVTLLDGDIVRKNLSSELGFSRVHRDLNIQRIGFVSSEITKHGGIAICAPIAPYRVTRRKVREMVEAHGGFIEVHVATPLETCESRDRKGLYAKARAGVIKEFTGISDPYEVPEHAELIIDTRDCTPMEAAQMIITRLESEGFVR